MEVAPESISNALKLQAEVTNLPPVGFEGNYAFPALQANFAAAQTADSLAGASPLPLLSNIIMLSTAGFTAQVLV